MFRKSPPLSRIRVPARPCEELARLLKEYFSAEREIRKGVCLLNAGRFDDAEKIFLAVQRLGNFHHSLPAFLAACLVGRKEFDQAASAFARQAEADKYNPTPMIRQALSLWSDGRRSNAVQRLRDAIRTQPECAELHFQLGTLLTGLDQHEEAELRFVQAITLDRAHTEAQVSLALCYGLRGGAGEALALLQRAQRMRPLDARINLLLTQAARAVQQQGQVPFTRAAMPEEDPQADAAGIAELSRVIEREPDFVDALLALSTDTVDDRVFAILLTTIRAALERQPEHAELHFHCGRVLKKLGRPDEAIDENERAVALNPRFTRALIELGNLYHQTDRARDAVDRLEQAVAAGAEYADVYYLLGKLYRQRGDLSRARTAFQRALTLNQRYQAARTALETLPV